MEKLGFRFEHAGVILDGWAHHSGCPQLPAPVPARAQRVAAGGVVVSERCPRECRGCAPRFLTLLSYQVGGDRRTAGCD